MKSLINGWHLVGIGLSLGCSFGVCSLLDWYIVMVLPVGMAFASALWFIDGSYIDVWRLNTPSARARTQKNKPYNLHKLTHYKGTLHYTVVNPSAAITQRTDVCVVTSPDPPTSMETMVETGYLQSLADATGCTVLCVDMAGFGFSSMASASSLGYIDFHAGQFAEFLQHMRSAGVEGVNQDTTFALVFTCVAALAAAATAANNPFLISHLVLGQCGSYHDELAWAHRVNMFHVLSTNIVGQLVMWLAPEYMSNGWFRAAARNRDVRKTLSEGAVRDIRKGAFFCLASAVQGLFFHRDSAKMNSDVLSQIKCQQPALLIWGAADRTHLATDKTAIPPFCANVPRGQTVVLEGVGHFPDLEATDEFLKLTAEFLKPKSKRQA